MSAKMGRPTKYTAELADRICSALTTSRRGLEDLCNDPDMDLPPSSTVWAWLARHQDFQEKYLRARECQTEMLYDEMSRIASAPISVEPEYAMAEMQRRRLAVDIMKFKLVKLQPKRFGERKDVDVNVKVSHAVSPEQFQQLLQAAAGELPPEQFEDAEEVYALPSGTVDEDDGEDIDELLK
jgi:hypothetical protein